MHAPRGAHAPVAPAAAAQALALLCALVCARAQNTSPSQLPSPCASLTPRLLNAQPADTPVPVHVLRDHVLGHDCVVVALNKEHLLTLASCAVRAPHGFVFGGLSVVTAENVVMPVVSATASAALGIVRVKLDTSLNLPREFFFNRAQRVPDVGDVGDLIGMWQNALGVVVMEAFDEGQCQGGMEENAFCLGRKSCQAGTCDGDPGAVWTMLGNNDKQLVVGLATKVTRCGAEGADTFEKVAPYEPWIDQVVGDVNWGSLDLMEDAVQTSIVETDDDPLEQDFPLLDENENIKLGPNVRGAKVQTWIWVLIAISVAILVVWLVMAINAYTHRRKLTRF